MKKWQSKIPEKCDLCGRPFGEHFYDGATILGPWALMCENCHATWGTGTGTGIGKSQKYLTKNGNGVDGFKETK